MIDVSDLMVARAERDEFGIEKDKRLPFLLPKVMEGRPIVSKSPLLSLPTEILGDIIDLIANDKPTLAALALVNSDCRQLARSCQFADVCFDYGTRSTPLLHHLWAEAQARENGASYASQRMFIGSCIRRVTVSPKAKFVAALHYDLYDSIWGDTVETVSDDQRAELREKASKIYLGIYRNPLLVALTRAMPHLEALVWKDVTCFDDSCFKVVTSLPIRHLKFAGAQVVAPARLEQSLVSPAMQLQSLYLGISLWTDKNHEEEEEMADEELVDEPEARGTGAISLFMTTLLQRCGKTLESLTINHGKFSHYEFFTIRNVAFERLRYLSIFSTDRCLDPTAWSLLLTPQLRHLELPLEGLKSLRQYLPSCQPLRDLETLAVPRLTSITAETAKTIIDFISLHQHIRKLSIKHGPQHLMENRLLSLLSNGNWSNLTSLLISWRGPGVSQENHPNIAYISPHSLDAINTVKSLEQICLSAGQSLGWRNQWLIDHNEVQSRLRDLEKLKKLALLRDTYRLPDDPTDNDVEEYYELRRVSSAERQDALERPQLDDDVDHLGPTDGGDNNTAADDIIWERAHRNRMLREAEKYAAVFPNLDWVYCGQIPMSIQRTQGPKGPTPVAIPLSKKRISCDKLLRQMFEVGQDD